MTVEFWNPCGMAFEAAPDRAVAAAAGTCGCDRRKHRTDDEEGVLVARVREPGAKEWRWLRVVLLESRGLSSIFGCSGSVVLFLAGRRKEDDWRAAVAMFVGLESARHEAEVGDGAP